MFHRVNLKSEPLSPPGEQPPVVRAAAEQQAQTANMNSGVPSARTPDMPFSRPSEVSDAAPQAAAAPAAQDPKTEISSPTHTETSTEKKDTPTMSEHASSNAASNTDSDSAASALSSPRALDGAAGAYQRPGAQAPGAAIRPANPYPGAYGAFAAPRAGAPATAASPIAGVQAGDRRLTIGSGIAISGEIDACDHLVVEGTVEAALKGARALDILENGTFIGAVSIEEATIAGRFEGDITVNGRLVVRSSGSISGSITYKELEVESGATIEGRLTPVGAEGRKLQGNRPAKKRDAAQSASTSSSAASGNDDGLFAQRTAAE